MPRLLPLLALLAEIGCYPETRKDGDSPATDTDTEADADTDSDTDTDTDTDADTDTDTDTDTAPLDADSDGYSEADGDCDDADDAVHPGATEVCENGKDDDCDGSVGACALTSRSLADADAAFTGEALRDEAGYSVSAAGDVNGDGFDDVLVGATGNDDGGSRAGAAYVVLGSASPTSRSLSTADAQFMGEAADDQAGWSVSTAGDVNGDGFGDVLVGAPTNDDGGSSAGAAYLLLGSASPTSRSLRTADAQFTGEAALDYAGNRVSTAGDVNDDGFDDMLVAAPYNDDGGSNTGATYLILGSGSPSTRYLGAADVQFTGDAQGDTSVSSAGDVDGDGFDDVVLGASGNADGGVYAGAAYLLLGSAAPTSRPLNAADAQFTGEAAGDIAGSSVSNAGDVNGDGFDDVLVGAQNNTDGGSETGAAYLLLGSASPRSRSLAAADAQFMGEARGDHAGISVSTAGDVDGDGFADVIVGACFNSDGGAQAGAAYLVLGSASTAGGSLGAADAQFTGEGENNLAGLIVSTAGDVNRDGFDDVLVGAYNGGAGAAYLIFGTGL